MLTRFLLLQRFDAGLLLLRLSFGLTLSFQHGWETFSTIPSHDNFPDPLGITSLLSKALMGTAEFVGALFVAVGFITRFSSFVVTVGFTVAVFIVHAGDPFGHKEPALLYLSAFAAVLVTGPGVYSIDRFLFQKETTTVLK